LEERFSVPVRWRVALVSAGGLVAIALVVAYLVGYLAVAPPTVQGASGSSAQLTLQTVAAISSGDRPDWVSYLVKDPSGRWIHSTIWKVPANTTIKVTIYQFDTASKLRNPFWAQPFGIVPNSFTVNGTAADSIPAETASHTFAIPELGLSVPLQGIADDAKNPCANAPCDDSSDHQTITFSFKTGAPGKYHWQCFVPCGAGFIYGNGGPMTTVGYMGGFLEVV
jgi:heme/copper-type cytochrome/quinol oxidase subunit 2